MTDTKRLTLRIPAPLHDTIVERAAERGYSLNDWITRALEYTVARKTSTYTETREVTL